MLAGQQPRGFCVVAENGAEDAGQRLGELVVQVVSRVDGDVILQDVDGILAALEVLGAGGALGDDVCDAVAEHRGGAFVALLHALDELDVCLFGAVVLFGEGFGYDQGRHVDFVLQEKGDLSLDVATEKVLARTTALLACHQ